MGAEVSLEGFYFLNGEIEQAGYNIYDDGQLVRSGVWTATSSDGTAIVSIDDGVKFDTIEFIGVDYASGTTSNWLGTSVFNGQVESNGSSDYLILIKEVTFDPILDDPYDDVIDAGDSNDVVYGEQDADTLYGGEDNDNLYAVPATTSVTAAVLRQAIRRLSNRRVLSVTGVWERAAARRPLIQPATTRAPIRMASRSARVASAATTATRQLTSTTATTSRSSSCMTPPMSSRTARSSSGSTRTTTTACSRRTPAATSTAAT